MDLALRFPADAVGVVVDTYHVWWDARLAGEIARAGPRIVGYQVCDWVLPLPQDTLLGRGHLGDGVIDFGPIAACVSAACYNGYVEMEIFNAEVWAAPADQTAATVRERFAAVLGGRLPARRRRRGRGQPAFPRKRRVDGLPSSGPVDSGEREVHAMGIVVNRHQGPPPGEHEIIALMRAEGLAPHGWGNAPGDTYGWHEHDYEKVLYCVRGRIVFHTGGGDAELGPGDRLVLPPHTPHAATVGAEGVRCVEAARQG